MSSVPVQLLIYVLPNPACSLTPVILPVTDCLEVQVGITFSFNISVMNLCNQNAANLTDLLVSMPLTGMTHTNLTASLTNSSVFYSTFTWTPQINQIGSQYFCVSAFTT